MNQIGLTRYATAARIHLKKSSQGVKSAGPVAEPELSVE
jgi:hypothetical protein